MKKEELKQNLLQLLDIIENQRTHHELIDVINAAQKLRPEIEALSFQGEGWISVEDRLPELGQRVLVWSNGTFAAIFKESRDNLEFKTDRFFANLSGSGWKIDGITDWMPLPTKN